MSSIFTITLCFLFSYLFKTNERWENLFYIFR
jgi:hypothetical protein